MSVLSVQCRKIATSGRFLLLCVCTWETSPNDIIGSERKSHLGQLLQGQETPLASFSSPLVLVTAVNGGTSVGGQLSSASWVGGEKSYAVLVRRWKNSHTIRVHHITGEGITHITCVAAHLHLVAMN